MGSLRIESISRHSVFAIIWCMPSKNGLEHFVIAEKVNKILIVQLFHLWPTLK